MTDRELMQQSLDALEGNDLGLHYRTIEALRAARAQPAPAVPDDMVMVPREPTQEMIDAADAIDPDQFWSEPLIQEDGTKHRTRDCDSVLYYRAMISAAPAVREPLTAERLQKHAMFAADAPPASAVVLVSSLHRLLGITGDSAPAVQPLTDEQIDEIWDGTFDSADPKRQLSFRQIITRAVEARCGITGDSK